MGGEWCCYLERPDLGHILVLASGPFIVRPRRSCQCREYGSRLKVPRDCIFHRIPAAWSLLLLLYAAVPIASDVLFPVFWIFGKLQSILSVIQFTHSLLSPRRLGDKIKRPDDISTDHYHFYSRGAFGAVNVDTSGSSDSRGKSHTPCKP